MSSANKKNLAPNESEQGTNPFRLTSTTSLFGFLTMQSIVCDLEVVDGPLQIGSVGVDVVALALGSFDQFDDDRHAMGQSAVGVCVLVCGVGGVHGCIVLGGRRGVKPEGKI